MRQRCEHGYVIDPEDRCPECERDALRRDNERLRAALREADKGLTAVIRQYAAHNHVTGEVIAGDEQYPWIRLALIGRDAARAALEDRT